MQSPHPERKPHSHGDHPKSPPAATASSGSLLLRICWLLLGSAFVVVFGFVLFVVLLKGPNPPATTPAEQTLASNENESPSSMPDDNPENDSQPVDPKPGESKRRVHGTEVERVLGGSFHAPEREDVPPLADPPPLPPPPLKTQPATPPQPSPLPPPSFKPQPDAPPRFPPPANTKDANGAIEKRLQASEEDLRKQLSEVPELRLFSDLIVQNFREKEKKDESTVKGVPRDQIDFAYNVQMNHYMRQAGLKEGLPLLTGANCRLDPDTAMIVQTLSKNLRDMGFVSVPGTPARVRSIGGGRGVAITEGSALVIEGSGGTTVISGKTNNNGTPREKIEAFKQWCDVNSIEKFRGALATLLQMLQVEDATTRLLLVRELEKAQGPGATAILAIRALADLSPDVRQAAIAALEKRPPGEYVSVLLKGLSYPWAPVADHAAFALRKLKPKGVAPKLVALLDRPDPSLPVLDPRTKKPVVRELVRLNHMRNCLLCHAPSANAKDGLVRGLVPTPGQPLPRLYYAGQKGNFVRADTTFLRQDFSANMPAIDVTPWPKEQRFDFVTRLRPARPEEMAAIKSKPNNYPQREAVLYALRGLTGKDGGDFAEEWRKTLGLAVRATEEKKDAPLDKASVPPKD